MDELTKNAINEAWYEVFGIRALVIDLFWFIMVLGLILITTR